VQKANASRSFPIIGGRVGAAVDLLRGHVAVRYGEHALLLQHLHGPARRPVTVRRQRRGQPPPGQGPGPERRRHVLQLPVQVELPNTGVGPGLALFRVPLHVRGQRRRRRRGEQSSPCRSRSRSCAGFTGHRSRSTRGRSLSRGSASGQRRPQAAAGARPAARFLHDRTVEQLSARHAGRPARAVRGPGTLPVVVTPTPSPAAAADPQTRSSRLRSSVRFRLRGHISSR